LLRQPQCAGDYYRRHSHGQAVSVFIYRVWLETAQKHVEHTNIGSWFRERGNAFWQLPVTTQHRKKTERTTSSLSYGVEQGSTGKRE
jgi:hypothetical protein